MHMTGSNGILSVPSEHLPGLVVLVLLVPTVWMALCGARALAMRGTGWAQRLLDRFDQLGFTAKAVLFGSLTGALVHAAIIPTHWGDERVTAVLFIVDTVGLAAVFVWTLLARTHWKTAAVLMLTGTAIAYALYVLEGWETMDLVGLITTTLELAAALVVLSPLAASSGSARRERWLALGAVPVAMVALLGTASIAATTTPAASASTVGTTKPASAMPGMGATATAPVAPLSLATDSPAGPIVWPDDMTTMAAGMKMATGDCTAQPSATEQKAAVALVDQTVTAVAPYKRLAAAKAAGYVPVTRSGARVVHYINPAIYRHGDDLNPSSIPVLVYVNTAHGAVLSAAMYLMPQSAGDAKPPQPGGCLTQWHVHTDLCLSGGHVVGTDASSPCAAGSVNQVTEPMMHVWVTPVTGGPLAPDPSARSEVEAAARVPMLPQLNGVA